MSTRARRSRHNRSTLVRRESTLNIFLKHQRCPARLHEQREKQIPAVPSPRRKFPPPAPERPRCGRNFNASRRSCRRKAEEETVQLATENLAQRTHRWFLWTMAGLVPLLLIAA